MAPGCQALVPHEVLLFSNGLDLFRIFYVLVQSLFISLFIDYQYLIFIRETAPASSSPSLSTEEKTRLESQLARREALQATYMPVKQDVPAIQEKYVCLKSFVLCKLC